MTYQDSITWLNLEMECEQDEIQDALEDRLFEHKRFFLNKAIISKLFAGQLLKVKKLQEVAESLNFWNSSPYFEVQKFDFSDTIIDAFQQFEKDRSSLKIALSSATSASDLLNVVHQLLNLQAAYTQKWPLTIESDESVLLSNEADSMELLSEIKALREQGILCFSDVKNSKVEAFPTFLNEWKRLSLLAIKENEWKKGFLTS
ncbi:MAG: hypothetical protein V4638_08855 [Bacteroidota bacterium]